MRKSALCAPDTVRVSAAFIHAGWGTDDPTVIPWVWRFPSAVPPPPRQRSIEQAGAGESRTRKLGLARTARPKKKGWTVGQVGVLCCAVFHFAMGCANTKLSLPALRAQHSWCVCVCGAPQCSKSCLVGWLLSRLLPGLLVQLAGPPSVLVPHNGGGRGCCGPQFNQAAKCSSYWACPAYCSLGCLPSPRPLPSEPCLSGEWLKPDAVNFERTGSSSSSPSRRANLKRASTVRRLGPMRKSTLDPAKVSWWRS